MDSIYHIETDIKCKVLHYGKEICVAVPGEDVSIELRKGRHRLAFISTENPDDQYSIMYEVPENDIEDFINVKLSPYKEKRLQKEAEDRSVAFWAEQKKLQEIKALEEQKRKKREEEIRRIRKEEEKKKAEQDAIIKQEEEKRRLWEERERRYQRFIMARDLYHEYVITSLPKQNGQVTYYSCCKRNQRTNSYCLGTIGTVFEPFIGNKTVGDKSEIIPVIKCTKMLQHFSEQELTEYFADVSFSIIKDFCKPSDHNWSGLFNIYPRHMDPEVEKKAEDIWKELKNKQREQEISRRLLEKHDASALCRFLFESKQVIKKDDFVTSEEFPLLNEEFSKRIYRRNKAIIDYFLYKVATSRKWRDLYSRMLDESYHWEEVGYKSQILMLMKSSLSDAVFECECKEYRLVYIDEACNEVLDATDSKMSVSCIQNGIMVWAKQQNRSFLYSIRDFKGEELFAIDYMEPDDRSLPNSLFSKYIRSSMIFIPGVIRNNGHIAFSNPPRELWVSGIINELASSSEDRFTIQDSDVEFANPHESISPLPDKTTCCLINGKYYISTYQGLLQIKKPKSLSD